MCGIVSLSIWERCNATALFLEQSSDREIHSALARWADAAGNRDRPDKRVGDDAEIECSAYDDRAGISGGGAESRSGFVPSAPINPLADELGEFVELTAESE